MPSSKFLGLPLWVWLVIIGMIAYNCYITTSLVVNENETKKETFANDDMIKVYNFNTTWCGHSVNFQPEWDKFSKNTPKNVVAIDAKCDDSTSEFAILANKFGVRGFPSVGAEKNGDIRQYNGPRTAEGLFDWVKNVFNEKPILRPTKKPMNKPIHKSNDNMLKIHNFNTTWCGHSVNFQPEWDKFAQNAPKNVVAIDQKCDDGNSEAAMTANKFGVRGFPTVLAEKNGETRPYNGPRTADALANWANSGCGF